MRSRKNDLIKKIRIRSSTEGNDALSLHEDVEKELLSQDISLEDLLCDECDYEDLRLAINNLNKDEKELIDFIFFKNNFVIAYLHMVLLGIISLFAFSAIFDSYEIPLSKNLKLGLKFFLFSFFTTESLLVLQAAGAIFNFAIPTYNLLLLFFSLFFPVSLLMIYFKIKETLAFQAFQLNNLVLRSL